MQLAVTGAPIADHADWLPAIEQFGEGIFIVFDSERIDQWQLRNEDARRRIDELIAGFETHKRKHPAGAEQRFPGGGYIALHSLADALMIEIALDCGYPASSLKERIYAFPPTDTYEAQASAAGHDVDRSQWRVSPPFVVADTDEEALRLASTGEMARFWREYMIPGMVKRGLTDFVKMGPEDTDEDVTPEYLARHVWLVGSPATVAERLVQLHRDTGGFGILIGLVFDFIDDREAWSRSMQLMKQEVIPMVERELEATALR